MKLLIITGIYPPTPGGPATYTKLLEDELPKKGFDVSVVTFDSVRHLPKGIRHVVFMFKLAKKAKGINSMLVQDTVSVGFPTFLYSKLFRKKYIIRVPGDYAWEQARGRFSVIDSIETFQDKKYTFLVELLKRVQRIVVSGASEVIVPSVYFKTIVDGWISKNKKATVIYNGVEVQYIIDSVGKSKKKNAKHYVSAGRFVAWKGFEELIHLFAKQELQSYVLTIYGDGPDHQKCLNLVNEFSLEKRVFLPGKIKRNVLLQEIAQSEGFILSSSFESFSFQLVEAMATGTPVIVSNVCNLPEIVTDKVHGLMFNFFDEEALLKIITQDMQEEGLPKRLSDAAIVRAQYFSIENMIEKLIPVIKRNQV